MYRMLIRSPQNYTTGGEKIEELRGRYENRYALCRKHPSCELHGPKNGQKHDSV